MQKQNNFLLYLSFLLLFLEIILLIYWTGRRMNSIEAQIRSSLLKQNMEIEKQTAIQDEVILFLSKKRAVLPANKDAAEKAKKEKILGVHTVSAYNPVESQTDGKFCIGARNINVCNKLNQGIGVCAANFVPIGTKLRVGKYIKCTVYDRTSTKYKDRVDVMFPANMINEAKSFGIKHELITLIN